MTMNMKGTDSKALIKRSASKGGCTPSPLMKFALCYWWGGGGGYLVKFPKPTCSSKFLSEAEGKNAQKLCFGQEVQHYNTW